ncbi:MAG: tetratricopeptide repeat protein, partial [Patescibacteria group bacterium]|nr:tetratricopeptide repeat protein [Patescibacteria group bacterium]
MSSRFASILDSLIIYLIKGLVFLLPLFFLPWTTDFFEFNKQGLLWLAVILTAVLWLVKMAGFEKKIIFKRTPLDIPILTFLAVALLASIFSQDRFSSFFGYYGNAGNSWLGLLALAIFYFLIVNLANVSGRLAPVSLLKLLFYSHGLILLSAFFSLFGLWDKIWQKANIFYSLKFNFLGNSSEMLAIYSVAMIALLAGMIFFGRQDGAGHRQNGAGHRQNGAGKISFWLFRIILFLSLIFLAITDFFLVWWGLGIIGCLFVFWELKKAGFKTGELGKKRILFFAFLILLASVFLIFPSNLRGIDRYLAGQDLSPEINLGFRNTALVVSPALEKNIMLGSGPGTFSYIFSSFRPNSLNNTDLWRFRFDRGASYILEILGTMGVLGILSYLLIFSSFLYLSFIFLKRKGRGEGDDLPFFLFAALVVLIFFQFFYYINTAILFLFWLALALLMVSCRQHPRWPAFKELKLDEDGVSFKALRLATFFLFFAWLVLAGFVCRYWLADFYARAGGEANLIKAARLNPHRPDYKIHLARIYLNEMRDEALRPVGFRDDEAAKKAIDKSIAWAKGAAKNCPNCVAAWETLGMVYRDIRFFTQGSEIWAAKAFSQASALEPSNPVIRTALGKVYLDADKLDEAEEALRKALELKNNYHEADFALARL